MPKQTGGAGARHWCFTRQATNDESSVWSAAVADPVHMFMDSADYMVYQVERAPSTGQVHIQGYVCFSRRRTMRTAEKLLGGHVHLEASRGTPEQNKAYCTKPETKLAGPWEYGAMPGGQGKSKPLDLAVSAIQDGSTLATVAAEYPAVWVHNNRGLASLAFMLRPSPPWRVITVHVLWGPTGVGKTRRAFESTEADKPHPYFVMKNAEWWDGYEGQDTIIFDDFYGQVRLSDMLRYLDGYPLQIPVKGGHVAAQWTKVYITSNAPPSEWWASSSESIPSAARAALNRRITEVVDMTPDDSASQDVFSLPPAPAPAPAPASVPAPAPAPASDVFEPNPVVPRYRAPVEALGGSRVSSYTDWFKIARGQRQNPAQ